MSSSDSEDGRMKGVQRAPRANSGAGPVPRKTHVIQSAVQEKRIQCSRLIRNKRFLIVTGVLVFLIILAIILGVTLGQKKTVEDNWDQVELIPLKWWQNATVYRVYVTSFADSDGDGRGDFKGLQEKLSYLKDLGVDVIWLSPIQNTNSVSGTDVIDFKSVKNYYGELQDFRDLLLAAQSMGMKVIMDIILNHSGTAHKWFQQSKLSTPPFRDYYIWNKGKSAGSSQPAQPPNNWVSFYGGSAWQWHDSRQEYYLSQFWKTEPDLNYRNPQIITEMNSVVNHWWNVGVDGVYLRDSSFLVEDAQFSDEQQLSNSQDYASLSHNYTRDLTESYQAVLNIFGAIQPRVGSERIIMMETNDRIMADERWTQTFPTMTTSALYKLNPVFSGVDLRTAVQSSIESFNKTKVWPTWVLGNEEKSRILTKFGQLAFGLQMMQLFLPGSASIYYGEEIQMTNTVSISYDDTVDSVARSSGPSNYTLVSRDPFHTPMKWNSSRNAGFTSATTPWLPINSMNPTVDAQRLPPNSVWNTMRDMIEIKRSSIALTNGTIDFPIVDNDVFAFTRTHMMNKTGFLIVWNIGNQRKTVSFADTTYISDELTTVRKIRPDGGRTDTSIVRKNDVTVESRELVIYTFWKQ